ncbi:hypothetical protein Kpol_1023p58 [Vanderwaltozyma polyspora DSM 70294]|uniref:Vacuolar protein sorting-associated protein 29 n=1 Tax=Vanderwaltozyma polyspora (strain ATCC 22028 / DSM 70294 / BCRC 21397 / CBS 2163 / NBRC 10782 / NRRL Y-8283 / UCD 57-17) TaxID=436907 RepID=A7TFT1_VANPO|nr:uncharacterized protein Kpol_1023p58 [Vanderwaltozyma polyspora DSM 70294]EDO18889.1 hypothetical protein Kpol_1023p58 [Vanderwaltozyma polyspora DSM 70294]
MLLLALADAHIPDRAIDLPIKFKKLLNVSNKISRSVLLGNCTKSPSLLKFVNDISPNVTMVRGEFDNLKFLSTGKDNNPIENEIPVNAVIKVGNFKIGCCSGYMIVPKADPLSLLALARQLDVDILLWGGTHNVEAYTLEGKFFVNPGSCTGAFNTDWPISTNIETSDEEITGIDKSLNTDSTKEEEIVKEEEESVKEEENDNNSKENKKSKKKKKKKNNNNNNKAEAESNKTEAVSNANGTDLKQDQEPESKEGEKNIEDIELDIDMSEFEVSGSNIPSFTLLDIEESTCTLYIYLYMDGEVKVDKISYTKES